MRMTMKTKLYFSDLMKLKTFDERFRYLKLNGVVGDLKMTDHRYLNQLLYRCPEWRRVRREIIIRDNGLDLGCEDHQIYGKIFVHHMNPITTEDVVNRDSIVFDPENLITVSFDTHNAIHYGDDSILSRYKIADRHENDTIPWR